MYNKTFKFKNTQATNFVYRVGTQVVFEGKSYNCIQETSQTPFQNPNAWRFSGLTEPYYSDNAPLKPYPNQIWISSTGIMYSYINDGNSTQWVQL